MARINEPVPSRPQRRIIDGKVASSNRTVWRLSENDIIGVGKGRGLLLTEGQLDAVSQYVEKHFAPNGEWFDVIDAALNSLGIGTQEKSM